METGKLRQRQKPVTATKAEVDTGEKAGHPGGDIKHGGATQILRLLLVIVYFMSSCFSYACPVLVGTFYCQKLTKIIGSSQPSSLVCRCTGSTEIFTMPTWP